MRDTEARDAMRSEWASRRNGEWTTGRRGCVGRRRTCRTYATSQTQHGPSVRRRSLAHPAFIFRPLAHSPFRPLAVSPYRPFASHAPLYNCRSPPHISRPYVAVDIDPDFAHHSGDCLRTPSIGGSNATPPQRGLRCCLWLTLDRDHFPRPDDHKPHHHH